jgi:hypothetical protein
VPSCSLGRLVQSILEVVCLLLLLEVDVRFNVKFNAFKLASLHLMQSRLAVQDLGRRTSVLKFT